jgi:hypothetical protein
MTRLLLALLILSGCGSVAPEEPVQAARFAAAASDMQAQSHGRLKRPFRVLFIGNSLTYTNDLPAMVEGLSKAAGDDPPLEAEMIAYGGYAIEDHLHYGDAVPAIERGGWDVVVMQQGPSTLPESRANLLQYAKIMAGKIRAVGARPAMYGVWPEEERMYAFDWGITNYHDTAVEIDGILCPAALAWKTAWKTDPAFPLYGPDRFHPSRLGTYLSALVIYAELRDKSPVGLTARFETVAIPPAQGALAEKAAQEVTLTKKRPGKPWADHRLPHADELAGEDAR